MKIALYEMEIAYENKQANLEAFTEALLLCKNKNVDFIAGPEMTFTGFSMNTRVTFEDGTIIEKMKTLAKENSIAIGFGYVKVVDSENWLCENHYGIVSKQGEIISDYVKIHPFSYGDEEKYFVNGDKICICRVEDFNVGTGICYDLRFPEIYQRMSDEAELIVQPANWGGLRRDAWKVLLKARAIENQCYIAGVNCIGKQDTSDYTGDSDLVDPNGDTVKPVDIIGVGLGKSRLLIYDIANDVEKFRTNFPTKHDRRDDLYSILKKS